MISKKHCIMCILLPILVSGVFGFFAGSTARQMGISHELTSGLAGLVGFLGAQTFNYVCLVLSTRYRKRLVRLKK
jgi:cyanate permease